MTHTPTKRARLAAEVLPAVLALVLAACGGSDDGAGTSAARESTTSTTTMATTTTEAMSTTTTAAPTTTGSPASTASDGDLPTELTGGTYVVGEEIRPGWWVSDQCGCYWAYVDEMGNETAGSSEDAEVRESDHAVVLGGCTWTWDG